MALSSPPSPGTSTERFKVAAAITFAHNLTTGRKHNLDVTGAASIEADLVSIPAPNGLVQFLMEANNPGNNDSNSS